MLLITSKFDGFRRCGVAHSVQPTEWADDRFSEEQVACLKAEPMLTVEVFDFGDGDGDPTIKAKKSKTKRTETE